VNKDRKAWKSCLWSRCSKKIWKI